VKFKASYVKLINYALDSCDRASLM